MMFVMMPHTLHIYNCMNLKHISQNT